MSYGRGTYYLHHRRSSSGIMTRRRPWLHCISSIVYVASLFGANAVGWSDSEVLPRWVRNLGINGNA